MEIFLNAIGIIFALLCMWTAVSFYIPTRFTRQLLRGMKDIKEGKLKSYKEGELLAEFKKERIWAKAHPVRAKLLNSWYRLRAFWFEIPDMPRDAVNEVKYVIQRATRGWSNRDAWSVGGHISRLTYEMLKHHKKYSHGYHELLPVPKGVKFGSDSKAENKYHKDCEKLWKTTLDKMIYAFKLNTQIAEGERDCYIEPKYLRKMRPSYRNVCKYLTKEEETRRQEGMALFTKNLHYIWD